VIRETVANINAYIARTSSNGKGAGFQDSTPELVHLKQMRGGYSQEIALESENGGNAYFKCGR
jgi:hypothetical protein